MIAPDHDYARQVGLALSYSTNQKLAKVVVAFERIAVLAVLGAVLIKAGFVLIGWWN
jgi:hypothetical protein